MPHSHSSQARTHNEVCPLTNLLTHFPATQSKFSVHILMFDSPQKHQSVQNYKFTASCFIV